MQSWKKRGTSVWTTHLKYFDRIFETLDNPEMLNNIPTAVKGKTCNARYIKADWLESVIWEKVKNVLSNPEILLAEVRNNTKEEQSQASSGNLELEIKSLTRQLKRYAGQERRLMGVLRLELATPDIVLDELN